MTSEDKNSSDDSSSEFEFITIPAMMMNKSTHDRAMMRATELQQSVDDFFDNLTGEQMFTFYRMLNYGIQVNSGMPTFWSGVAATYLRKIFHMCPSCGQDEHTLEEGLLGGKVDDPQEGSPES